MRIAVQGSGYPRQSVGVVGSPKGNSINFHFEELHGSPNSSTVHNRSRERSHNNLPLPALTSEEIPTSAWRDYGQGSGFRV